VSKQKHTPPFSYDLSLSLTHVATEAPKGKKKKSVDGRWRKCEAMVLANWSLVMNDADILRADKHSRYYTRILLRRPAVQAQPQAQAQDQDQASGSGSAGSGSGEMKLIPARIWPWAPPADVTEIEIRPGTIVCVWQGGTMPYTVTALRQRYGRGYEFSLRLLPCLSPPADIGAISALVDHPMKQRTSLGRSASATVPGTIEVNKITFVSSVLDPRFVDPYVGWTIDHPPESAAAAASLLAAAGEGGGGDVPMPPPPVLPLATVMLPLTQSPSQVAAATTSTTTIPDPIPVIVHSSTTAGTTATATATPATAQLILPSQIPATSTPPLPSQQPGITATPPQPALGDLGAMIGRAEVVLAALRHAVTTAESTLETLRAVTIVAQNQALKK
jgi:hypothetical protein